MTVITERFLTVIGCVVMVIVGGLLIEVLLSFQFGWPFGHSQTGHVVGWVGLAVILTVFVYSVKKRNGRESGWPKGWFLVHQVAGVVGPLLILIHAGPHFHALIPMLALLAMFIVAVSSVIGVAVHRKAVRLLSAARSQLVSQGLSHEDVEDRLYDLASGEETFRIWQMIHIGGSDVFSAGYSPCSGRSVIWGECKCDFFRSQVVLINQRPIFASKQRHN